MSKALAWIRKSKGSDDDIGLEDQREQVGALAESVADDVDRLDLGVQTGFSSMTRDGRDLLDLRDDVQAALDRLRNGEYDFLAAYDDNRVCRDDFFSVIEYAAEQGGAEILYVDEVPDESLTHDIRRRINRDTKEREIEKSQRAVQKRQEQGKWQGGAPFGTHFPAGEDDIERDPEEWSTLQRVFELLEQGASYREISNETGLSVGGVCKINDRGREFYRQYGDV